MPNSPTTLSITIPAAFKQILSQDAINFLLALHLKFNDTRLGLLKKRKQREQKIAQGELPNFLPETEHIRKGDWTVAPIPQDLQNRRVEITGPVDKKMVINALNSGANVFMADFEDANSPTWENVLAGQQNLYEANRRTISYYDEIKNKKYELNADIAKLLVRPRGWHLGKKNMVINDQRISGSLFDFGLYFFHNAKYLVEKKTAPYFYLPKIESHLEAKLWNDVFVFSQNYLNIPQGAIKATVLIETILASFELDEILYELKDHIVGLNCGRWDYIFSYIKKLRHDKRFILPDRSQVTMTAPFMKAYSELVIQTCHKRKAFAMGGMAAFIPIKNDEIANQNALNKVREDKEREAKAGHDGTWVAHPGLVAIAKEQFDKYMPTPNQLHQLRQDVCVTATDLLTASKGEITLKGFQLNIDISLQYIESWLRGVGCVPIYNMMEDAATAEISRAQLWQWVHHNAVMSDGTLITKELYQKVLKQVMLEFEDRPGFNFHNKKIQEAAVILNDLVLNKDFLDFLTLSSYEQIH